MAQRRHNGEGTIGQRRDGRWQASLRHGGKRRTVYGATERECRRKLRDLVRAVEAGAGLPDDQITVATLLAEWRAAQAPTIRASSQTRYRELIDRHLVPALGRVRVAKLSARQVSAFERERLAAGLSPRTVTALHTVLHAALDLAVRWDLVPRNVGDQVDAPRTTPYAATALAPEQVATLLAHYQDDRYGALFALAALTGLRSGELLALRWSDVDHPARRLTVRRSARRLTGRGIVMGDTKSGKPRSVGLPEPAVAALRWQATQQYAERSVAADWQNADLVFSDSSGRAVNHPTLMQTHLHPFCARLGLPRIRLHDLRHTYASILSADGVPLKTIAAALGHAQIGITADTYAHVAAGDRAAADAIERRFG